LCVTFHRISLVQASHQKVAIQVKAHAQ
jgi:hypothetical protein